MKKQFFEDIKNAFLFLLPYLLGLAVATVILFGAYLIAVSDLPAWFKFFLLR